MRRDVTPEVHFLQMVQPGGVRRVRRLKVQGEAESIEVSPNVVQVRVAVVEASVGPELLLDQHLERRPYPGGDDQRGLGVEVATVSLEVGAQQDDAASDILLEESGICRGNRLGSRALGLDLSESGHPIRLPTLQGRGRHPYSFPSIPCRWK